MKVESEITKWDSPAGRLDTKQHDVSSGAPSCGLLVLMSISSQLLRIFETAHPKRLDENNAEAESETWPNPAKVTAITRINNFRISLHFTKSAASAHVISNLDLTLVTAKLPLKCPRRMLSFAGRTVSSVVMPCLKGPAPNLGPISLAYLSNKMGNGVCAIFPDVYDRYQSRVAWLIPFYFFSYVCRLLTESNKFRSPRRDFFL